MNKIKITLRGAGGELDCRVVTYSEAHGDDVFDQFGPVNDAVKDIALNCIFSVGDTITIEEID